MLKFLPLSMWWYYGQKTEPTTSKRVHTGDLFPVLPSLNPTNTFLNFPDSWRIGSSKWRKTPKPYVLCLWLPSQMVLKLELSGNIFKILREHVWWWWCHLLIRGWPADVTYKHFPNLDNTELAFSNSKPVLLVSMTRRLLQTSLAGLGDIYR